MKIEHKIFSAEVKKFDDENLIVEHFISTEHKDRGGDIMRAKGMKIVGKPVVLMLHGRGPMASEPIAKPLSITVDEFKGVPGVLARTQFFPDEVGTRLYQKIKGGWIPNWSIGFSIDEAKDIVEAGRYAGRDVTKWQLLEYSPVGVPMNPFAQTIKEFLDTKERGIGDAVELVAEGGAGGWFGLAEEKSCTGCGACDDCKKPEDDPITGCPTCKKTLTSFFKEGGGVIGTACEKCEPERFDELMKAIAPPKPDEETEEPCITCGKKLWKEWTKEIPYAAKRVYCKAGCEIVSKEPPADPPADEEEGGVMLQLRTLAGLVEGLRTAFKDMPEKLELLDKKFAKLEPLLKTLPPEPEGGEKGDEEHPENPPESKTPPRLVIVREEETPEAERQAAKARILAIAREVIGEAAKQEIDRMKGRVP